MMSAVVPCVKKLSWLAALVFVISGCAAILPTSDLRSGMPLEQVKNKIHANPTRDVTVLPPEGEHGNLRVLEYKVANAPNQDPAPHWLLFSEDKLVTYGVGDAKAGELMLYDLYYSYAAEQGVITHEQAEQRKIGKITGLYGMTLSPIYKEYLAYRVELASKLDAKEIDVPEFNRLLAEKNAALSASAQAARDAAVATEKARINDSLLLFGLGLQLMQPQQPMYTPSINCTSVQQGVFTNTTCH